MRSRLLLGVFDREEDLVGAVEAAREARIPIYDAYAPYPVHGLDEAMGLRRSRLGLVTFAGGLAGALSGALVQWWTSAVDWPLNVGGKPPASWPAFVPVIFELMVLFGGLSTVLALFVRCRLRPRLKPAGVQDGVTDDRFVLALEDRDGSFDRRVAEALLSSHGARELLEGGA